MMQSFSDSRRGYDDRFDTIDSRYGRSFDARNFERPARRSSADWMTRETPWLRSETASPWLREFQGPREPAWLRDITSRYAEFDGPTVMNVIDVVAQSPYSWEDATQRAIMEASRTVRGIRSLWIQDMIAVPDEEHGVSFRIHARASYALEENRRRR